MRIKNESNFTPAPEGVHNAVCVDIVDLGMIDGVYGAKHKLNMVWEIEEQMPDKRLPFLVFKRYTASIHKKSTLRKDLNSWRGRDFTDEEAKEFDLDKVIGAPCQLVIQHAVHEGTTYANVIAITKAKVAMKPNGGYKRVKDRDGYKPPTSTAAPAENNNDPELEADDIPF